MVGLVEIFRLEECHSKFSLLHIGDAIYCLLTLFGLGFFGVPAPGVGGGGVGGWGWGASKAPPP